MKMNAKISVKNNLMFFLLFGCLLTSNISVAQDIIYKNDRTEIKSKVVEISLTVINYKDFNSMLDSTINSIPINDVFMIIYENGEKEVFKHISNNDQTQNKKNNYSNSAVSKDNIKINLIDKRTYPLIIGEVPGFIRGTKMKSKDPKNKWFPAVANIFKERLCNKGFTGKTTNPAYTLEININKLFYNRIDKVVYVKTDQVCYANIKLTRISDNKIVYNSDLLSSYSSKAADIRDYCRVNGYKWTKIGTLFLIVIDDMINQLMKDDNFKNVISE